VIEAAANPDSFTSSGPYVDALFRTSEEENRDEKGARPARNAKRAPKY
jgi:hypothetical protein